MWLSCLRFHISAMIQDERFAESLSMISSPPGDVVIAECKDVSGHTDEIDHSLLLKLMSGDDGLAVPQPMNAVEPQESGTLQECRVNDGFCNHDHVSTEVKEVSGHRPRHQTRFSLFPFVQASSPQLPIEQGKAIVLTTKSGDAQDSLKESLTLDDGANPFGRESDPIENPFGRESDSPTPSRGGSRPWAVSNPFADDAPDDGEPDGAFAVTGVSESQRGHVDVAVSVKGSSLAAQQYPARIAMSGASAGASVARKALKVMPAEMRE